MAEYPRITDIAEAAGVSVSTVSNVLNRPQSVAKRTRNRVDEVINRLNFVPNQHAAALRRRTPPSSPADSGASPFDVPKTASSKVKSPRQRPSPAAEGLKWNTLTEGEPVLIAQGGEIVGSGVVDATMADGSTIWIWMSNGLGRRMLHAEDGFDIRPAAAP
jgi:hypothetical protein